MEKNTLEAIKVSIIVPMYNTKPYVQRCLESLINQSYKNIEIIIVDDNSTDGSYDIIESYLQEYPHLIKYFKNEQNSGVGFSRNLGIEISTGKYISFVDSDDWIDTDFIIKLVLSIEKNKADIAIAGIMNDFDYYNMSTKRYSYMYENTINGKYALNLLSKSFNNDIYLTPMVCGKLYEKEFILKNNITFNARSYYEDDIFTFEAFYLSKKIVIYPETFYHYFQRGSSITHTFSKKHITDLKQAFEYLDSFMYAQNMSNEHKYLLNQYFNRTFKAMVNRLLQSNESSIEIKKYLHFITETFITQNFISKIIDDYDIERLARFFEI